MVLGCDAAGMDPDGNEVIVHAVMSSDDWRGDETLDPKRSLFSEIHDGTLRRIRRRARGATSCRSPPSLSFEAAACLPTAWLTAYRMLFTNSGAAPGRRCSCRVRAAASRLRSSCSGAAAGYRVWVTSRERGEAGRAVDLGAHAAFETGARLPERVDAVMETVGAPTWNHSLKALRPAASSSSRARPRVRSRSKTCAASSSCSSASSARRWAPATNSSGLARLV